MVIDLGALLIGCCPCDCIPIASNRMLPESRPRIPHSLKISQIVQFEVAALFGGVPSVTPQTLPIPTGGWLQTAMSSVESTAMTTGVASSMPILPPRSGLVHNANSTATKYSKR